MLCPNNSMSWQAASDPAPRHHPYTARLLTHADSLVGCCSAYTFTDLVEGSEADTPPPAPPNNQPRDCLSARGGNSGSVGGLGAVWPAGLDAGGLWEGLAVPWTRHSRGSQSSCDAGQTSDSVESIPAPCLSQPDPVQPGSAGPSSA